MVNCTVVLVYQRLGENLHPGNFRCRMRHCAQVLDVNTSPGVESCLWYSGTAELRIIFLELSGLKVYINQTDLSTK